MDEAARALTVLREWQNFYVIIGSAGAALTGLQFVVMALISGSGKRSTGREISAFGTPTVIHFCAALLVSGIVAAPWHSLASIALAFGVCGFAGFAYSVIVIGRAVRQTGYQPVFEDWLWHAVLPLIAYALIVVAAIFLPNYAQRFLFLVALATLLLLFIGIHNSWDTITYFTINASQKAKSKH